LSQLLGLLLQMTLVSKVVKRGSKIPIRFVSPWLTLYKQNMLYHLEIRNFLLLKATTITYCIYLTIMTYNYQLWSGIFFNKCLWYKSCLFKSNFVTIESWLEPFNILPGECLIEESSDVIVDSGSGVFTALKIINKSLILDKRLG